MRRNFFNIKLTTRNVLTASAVLPVMLSLLLMVFASTSNYDRDAESIQLTVFFVFAILLFWGIGLLLGILIAVLAGNPRREPFFYLTGQLLVYFSILFFFALQYYKDQQHDREYGNQEWNEDYFRNSGDSTQTNAMKLAFAAVAGKMEDANQIRLAGSFFTQADSLINNASEVYYYVQLIYYKKEDTTPYKAGMKIFRNHPYIQYLDDVLETTDYLRIDSMQKQVKNNLRQTLEMVDDSTREALKKDFDGFLEIIAACTLLSLITMKLLLYKHEPMMQHHHAFYQEIYCSSNTGNDYPHILNFTFDQRISD